MSRQRRERAASPSTGGLELELGGTSLLLAGVVVVALCSISFWLGRQSVPLTGLAANGAAPSPADAAIVDGGDVEQELTFFNRLEKAPNLSAQGDERTVLPAPEPEERSEPSRPSAPEPEAERATALPAAGGGSFHVQVLATTEKEAAEAMAARLKKRGFPARLTSGDFKGQVLFRVRVGGYAEETAARQVALAIQEREGLQTWITR